jgi:hypothetical protein
MRHDHTDWLIHFVRDRLPDQDFPGETEDDYNYLVGGELDAEADAFSVLKNIIRLGGLYPGYSFRSGKTTLFGCAPVVCATEMPLYSFASYVKTRAKTECVSAYGIAFLKSEFFAAGGRPVIYGLSVDNVHYERNEQICRILDTTVLPLDEQYRYVSYNPTGQRWIDWSHEREWRWKVRNEDKEYVWGTDGNGQYGPIPGLPLFSGTENEGAFSKLCIIVWNTEEATEIQRIITGLYLAKSNNYDTPFSRNIIDNSSIIILEDVVEAVESNGDLNAQTIEGLQVSSLCCPIKISTPPKKAKQIVETAFVKARKAGNIAANEFIKKHDITKGYCGFANAVTTDVTDPLVQYMLANKHATGPYDDRVHIDVSSDWPFSQSMDYNEHVYYRVADVLKKELNINVWMESRPD